MSKKSDINMNDDVEVFTPEATTSEALSVRDEVSMVGHAGGGFDSSDVRVPFFGLTHGVGKLFTDLNFNPGDVVLDNQFLVVPKGKSPVRAFVISCSNKYWTEYSYTPGVPPRKFATLSDVEAAGLRTEWVDQGSGVRLGPEVTPSADMRLLVAAPQGHLCPACSFNIDGDQFCQGIFTFTKKSYSTAVVPYVNSYLAVYAPTPEKKRAEPYQCEWELSVLQTKADTGNSRMSIGLRLKKLHAADSTVVQEICDALNI